MGLFLGVRRAASFWSPQLKYLLRQASACLLLMLIGVQLGLEFSDFFRTDHMGRFLGFYICGLFIVNRWLAEGRSTGRAPERQGFEVIPMKQGNSQKPDPS